MTTQFITCIFKVHNPSGRKRQVMDQALADYTVSYQSLLDWARANEDLLATDGKYRREYKTKAGQVVVTESYTGKSIARLLPSLRVGLHSSARDSLVQDVAGNLASYFALKEAGETVGFPKSRDPHPDAIHDAEEHFALVGSDLEDYEESKSLLLKRAKGSVMPLFFGRADAASQTSTGAARNRNFSLLWNTRKNQLLAVLYLLPAEHPMGQPLGVDGSHLVRLDTGEIFKSNSRCGIIVPLQLGANGWQQFKFLEPCRSTQADIQSAYLCRDDRNGEYFLHVSFRFQCPTEYNPETYLGLDHGILFTAGYALVDAEGEVIENGLLEDELRELQIKHGQERERLGRNGKPVTWRHYKRRAYDNILHVLANTLVSIALENRSQLVLEDLNIRVAGSRVRSRFARLEKMLRYKCKLAGVPIRTVFAAYSSQICPQCGAKMVREDRVVSCEQCDFLGHSDMAAAINIARRALYKKADWKKRGGYWGFHRSFANGAGCSTKEDLRQGAVTHPVSAANRETIGVQLNFWSLSGLTIDGRG